MLAMPRPRSSIRAVCTRFAASLALAAAIGAAGPAAHAQTTEELAEARKVFVEGKQLEGKGNWADALEKFKKVAMVKMTPQVRFHIALCEENLGKLVSAIKGFDLAAEEAKLAGSAAAEVEKLAPERAAALRGRVAKLRLDPSGKLIDSKITVDDVAITAKELGTEMPADPGAHVIEVRDKDGKSTFKKEISLKERGSETVEVTVDDKEAPAAPLATDAPPPPPPPSRAPVYVAGAVGAAAFAASAVFWVLRANALSEAIDVGKCKVDPVTGDYFGCDKSQEGRINELKNQGRTDALLGGILLGVGGAGAATAVGFLIANAVRKPAPASAPAKATVRLIPTGTGVQIVGVF